MKRCPWPHKRPYRSRAKARKARRLFTNKKEKLDVFYCRNGGHYHLGRPSNRRSDEEIQIERYLRKRRRKDETP